MSLPELDAIKARKADGEPLRHGDLTKLLAALEAVLAMELNGDGQGYDTALERVHETVERALKEEQ